MARPHQHYTQLMHAHKHPFPQPHHTSPASETVDKRLRDLANGKNTYGPPTSFHHPFSWIPHPRSVAIVSGGGAGSPPLVRKESGRGYVAGTWGGYAFVGVYFCPNKPLAVLLEYLEALGPVVRRLAPLPVLVLGDLNAKSVSWGSAATDPRGRAVEEWAAEIGVSPVNRGRTHTCVCAQGGSVVDVTFATHVATRRVRDWRVLDVETLSDHNYIRFEISTFPAPNGIPPKRTSGLSAVGSLSARRPNK
ncbi:putative endonuclease/reverse transcriptase [Danaus plexippus plexippus]|uniref:Endonuclease/reverse transcriptase n=1 Tax=Danaus plexippus plexippus TaxID=278856 RepID=A0A212EHR0_DANPL|nr:putative endonuclease/reverse transcriptase [Danaus plexippus plexippus]